MGQIYKLDFSNGKSYIGMTTKTAEERFKGHKKLSEGHRRFLIYKAWSLHGEPALVVLATLENDLLPQAEIEAIKLHGTLHPGGYNSTTGGEISPMLFPDVVAKLIGKPKGVGRKHTEESKAKMALAAKGNKKTFGQKRSKEFKEKMSKILKERWASLKEAS